MKQKSRKEIYGKYKKAPVLYKAEARQSLKLKEKRLHNKHKLNTHYYGNQIDSYVIYTATHLPG